MSKKIYNALFYSVVEYIHQLNMLSHVKYRNSNFTTNEKNLIISKCPKLKENGSKYRLLEKIYNALFYTVLEYIAQLSMLSDVKYKNSNFT